jgi:ribonuclease E
VESRAPEPQSEPAHAEAPKRRSTVREPAPFAVAASSDAISPERTAVTPSPVEEPALAPAPLEAPAEQDDKPRRSGWWSKRMFGKD